MSIETYSYREEMLDLREKLLEAEAAKISGAKTHTIEEVRELCLTRKTIDTVKLYGVCFY